MEGNAMGDSSEGILKDLSMKDIPDILMAILSPYVGLVKVSDILYGNLRIQLADEVPDEVKRFAQELIDAYRAYFFGTDEEEKGVEKQGEGVYVPPEYRWYIKEDMIGKLPSEISIHTDATGRIFVDLRELKKKRKKKSIDAIWREIGGRVYVGCSILDAYVNGDVRRLVEFATRKWSEEERSLWADLVSFAEFRGMIKRRLGLSGAVDVAEAPSEGIQKKGRWKTGCTGNRIEVFINNIPKEEIIGPIGATALIIKGKLDKARHTLAWYYYHTAGHLLFRKWFDDEMLDELREWVGRVKLGEYAEIDLEEFWCEAFALYVLTGGEPSKYKYVPKEFEETLLNLTTVLEEKISEWRMKILLDKDHKSKSENWYVYDSFDAQVGVLKSPI
ncbi:hypothetical protein P8X24_10970 [Pyrococcus kukulkanii]|uniref:hypothetical protein n=1 Tax=Pyrococcus kukulkanii TaxID=1609559 RepID=UPI0035693058